MWDFSSLKYELVQRGFVYIRKCDFGDASDPLLAGVEDHERFVYLVAVESIKMAKN